ncbi:unnamed protein product [Calypogeia fissa]
MVPPAGTNLRSSICVYHRDKDGVLHSLQNFDLLERILNALSRGQTPPKPLAISRADQERFKKIGLNTRPPELDFVIEFPWDARSFITMVAKANDAELRRRVLVMALDRIRRPPSLSKVLAAKRLKSFTIRENPYLTHGHAPYENFIESLLATTDAREKLFDVLLESAGDKADRTAFYCLEKQGVRTVFHGTNHAVMDNILNAGLDPNCRSGHLSEDYFGIDHLTILRFTKKNTVPPPQNWKLLVFMIIVQPVDVVPYSGAVAVASNKFQLPLAEITLDTGLWD